MSPDPPGVDALTPELRTGALDELWRYAVSSPSKQTRSKVLFAAVAVATCGGDAVDSRVATAATAVEVLHLTSLAHDDVLDDGDVRRGLASLPGYFGAPLAAAVGGVFFGRALGLFASCGDEAVTLATQTAMRMCEGQMLELRSLRDLGRTPAEYFDAVAGKTAGMFWLATQLGGALGEADPATQDALALYGEALGIAYQVIDDILDITAGQQRTGKSHGNDLHNGNYTLPVIYALEECPDLAELLRNDAETQTVVDRLLDTRAIARACADARRWIQQATDAVTALPAAGGLLEIASAELGLLSGVPA